MSRNRFVLVMATLSLALSPVIHGQRADPNPPCVFPEVHDPSAPVVVGPEGITKRLQLVQPLDAPVRFLRADFTGAALTTDGTLAPVGFFRFTHTYALEVINITDQIATVLDPAAYAYSKGDTAGQHAGGGLHALRRTSLGPGQRGVLRGNGGFTEGSLRFDDDVRIKVGIAAVTFGSCTWNNFRRVFPFGPGKATQPDTLDRSASIPR